MNDTPADNQSTGQEQPAVPPAGPRQPDTGKAGPWTVLTSFLLIVTLLAAGSALYLTYRDRSDNSSARATLDNLVGTAETLGARLGEVEAQLEQLRGAQEATSRALLDLTRELPGSNEDWALAEVEFLLIIATHHALLERDLNATLDAMQTADLRLRGLDNPDLDPVRAQLAQDISRLKELNQTDTSGLALMLGDLANRVNSLPLIGATGVKDGSTHGAGVAAEQDRTQKGILDSIWRELKNLVIIKHDAGGRQALLLPGQEYFVYQNLRLELESARLSLLRRDTENLHTSVAFLQKLLTEYFVTEDPAVADVMAVLQQLSSTSLDPAIPDISSSLESLRAYMREKATASPPVEENQGPRI